MSDKKFEVLFDKSFLEYESFYLYVQATLK